jgi:membrane protein
LQAFLGAHAYADTASHLIFDTWPESIAAPISREVVNVLTIERGGLLTLVGARCGVLSLPMAWRRCGFR